MALSKQIIKSLQSVATGTVTTVLLKKGIRRSWMRGPVPLREGQKAHRRSRLHAALRAGARRSGDAGNPGRRRSRPGPRSRRCRKAASRWPTPWASTDAGIFGDILCARMVKRGVAALVTDGVVRDIAGVLGTGPAGLVPRRRGPALGRRPHLRRLAGADRLRRRRGLPRRRDRGRRRRRRGHPAGAGRGGRRR